MFENVAVWARPIAKFPIKKVCPQITQINADGGKEKSGKAKRKDDNSLSSDSLS